MQVVATCKTIPVCESNCFPFSTPVVNFINTNVAETD